MNKKDFRDLFEEPIMGRITQGSIFNGAKSRFYPGCSSVYGIIISPRCDIEQKKVPLYYYLPAIKIEDWVKVDFPPLYISALEKEVKGCLKSCLYECGESESILESFRPADIERTIRKHKPQLSSKVENRLEVWKAIDRYKQEGCSIKCVTDLDSSNVRKNIFDDLITHKNPSYYFLENEQEGGGFVLRMREISRLSPEMLFKIAKGIEGHLTDQELRDSDLRQLDESEIFMPLYVLKSPFIEHVMQHFMQQFNKIGVEDVPKVFVNNFSRLI